MPAAPVPFARSLGQLKSHFPQAVGGTDGLGQVGGVRAQGELTSAGRGSPPTLQDTEQKGPRARPGLRNLRQEAVLGSAQSHGPWDGSPAKGIEWALLPEGRGLSPGRAAERSGPALCWPPPSTFPVLERWPPGLVTV